VNRDRLRTLLEQVRSGEVDLEAAVESLRTLPFEAVGEVARVDHHRELRSGVPEVVLGEWKTAEDIAAILASLAKGGRGALATRVAPDKAAAVRAALPDDLDGVAYHEVARALVVPASAPLRAPGSIAVVSAGTSDRPVASEAAVTAEFLGHEVVSIDDVGIAGLPRLIAASETIRRADVAVVVAGMEGALPSVLASLIAAPVVAVPTSVGYGVGLGGFVAMLSMLGGCAPGVTVVNIDNGFGGAVAAARMCRIGRDGA
jgi:pyridinium-3,5-biscarboxylic acid mononucleotide synthase